MSAETSSGEHRPRLGRAILSDLIAFVAIVVALVVTHESVVRHGGCLNDPAWYFHFGRRTLQGDVPYRDYVFQVGPLPIFVDAGFQAVFGGSYVASLYAGIFTKILRVFAIWMIARRLASMRAAALLSIFCAFDLSFGWIYHWSTPYSQLFYTLAGLFLLLASRASGRAVHIHLALAGSCAGLIVSARQSTAVMTAAVLLAISGIMLYRREFFTARRFAALWGGFAAGLVVVFGALALLGALGPAIQQMFLDAPEKKSLHGIDVILDPIGGGMLSIPGRSWWGGLLNFLGLPILFVALVIRATAHRQAVPGRALGMITIPVLVIIALAVRDAVLSFERDVPRMLMLVVTVLAVLAPDRIRRWFGVAPIVIIGLVALPLASDWANELSFPGPGWGDLPGLIPAVVLLALASTRISARTKTALCAGFATVGLAHATCAVQRDVNPFTRPDANDGTLADNHHTYPHPMMRGMWINEARKASLDWLAGHVKPGATCFLYGNLVAIYDILDCANPTRIDTTITDFLTAADAREAIAVLEAHPPEFLIAQDTTLTNPSLEQELGPGADYSPLNPKASRILHSGLRRLIPRYELLGLVRDAIGPTRAKQIGSSWDGISATRLYRRRPP